MKYVALAVRLVVVGGVGYWLIRSDAGAIGLFGIALGSIATLVGGWRTGIAVSIGCFVVAGLGATVTTSQIAVCVFISVVAGLCAYTSRFGLHAAWLPVIILASLVVSVPPSSGSIWIRAALVGVGGLVGVGVCLIPPPTPTVANRIALTEAGARIYASLMAGLALLGMWAIVGLGLGHGYWLIAALATCAQPSPTVSRRKSIQRQVGTIVGGLLGLGITTATHNNAVLLTTAIVLLLLCVASLSKGYEFSVGFAAAGIVVLAGISDTAATIAAERIGLTVVGGSLVLVTSIAITPLLARINRSIALVDSGDAVAAATT